MELWVTVAPSNSQPWNYEWQWRHLTVKNGTMSTVAPSKSQKWNYDCQWCHQTVKNKLWVALSLTLSAVRECPWRGALYLISLKLFTINYDWKWLFVGTVPAFFSHWPLTMEQWLWLWVTVAPPNSQKWNYEWKRLCVGTVPANFCHWPLTMEL